jgi:two-component system cell cycle sensor histidine kinase/response regulator CckA
VGADPSFCGAETILVVEDEMDVNFFLETIMESHGYHVLPAHNHDEAIKLFTENKDKVALVFSDIGLPKVDGITVCTELKKLKPDLSIILSSGYSPREFKDRIGELAPNAFVPKPYNTRDVLQCIRMVLKQHAGK